MRVLDSRRLTGPGLLLDRPGVVIDLEVDPSRRGRAIAAWREAVARLLASLGWTNEQVAVREFAGGASLAFTAPPDALYAACEVNEEAWAAAETALGGGEPVVGTAAVERLRALIETERNPALLALRDEARARGLRFLHGDDLVSIGSGRGVRVWPERELPDPSAVDWGAATDVPVALVTGSNGKTTVVRVLAAMARAAGRTPGLASTEGVLAGGRLVDAGDYSGPSGARLVLRQPEVEIALLETARGGLLRRGLAVERAETAVVTNIADDHLGEFGVESLEALADAKLLVARAVGDGGRLVLNADDPVLAAAAARLPAAAPIAWFSLDPANPLVQASARRGAAAWLESDALLLVEGGRRERLARVADMPIALGGAARHNIANALAAVLAAAPLGIPIEAVRETLERFGADPADNPGRATLLPLGGVRVLVDYAHNPHGIRALAGAIAPIAAARRLVMVGQAGDRSDDAIRELARAALELRPDRVLVKEMANYLRGRAPGEVPALLADELHRHGMGKDRVCRVASEPDGAREALAWARPGDLLVLTLHEDRQNVLSLLERLRSGGWTAGEPLPTGYL